MPVRSSHLCLGQSGDWPQLGLRGAGSARVRPLARYDGDRLGRPNLLLPARRLGTTAADNHHYDYDHDYDLDLLLLGTRPAVVRNNGNGTFLERPNAFPFAKNEPLDAAVFALREDTAARDLIVTYRDHAAVLYRDFSRGRDDVTVVAGREAA